MAGKIREVKDAFGKVHQFTEGLEGVIATTTEICFIDGQAGKLLYRGIPIEQLAEHSTYEETSFFLLYGHLPTSRELGDFIRRLKSHRAVANEVFDIVRNLPKSAAPMSMLRTAISSLGHFDQDAEDDSLEKHYQRAEHLIAAFPTVAAGIQRIRKGLEPIAPDPELGHAANFLYMLNGERPTDYAARVMDVALILHAEHGFNASTFTARVIISTLSDMYSAVTGAIGSLKGPLHGGANERVMRMLMEIGSADRAEDIILQKLRNKDKIMGFGHRVYRALDPRAKILMQFSQKLAEQVGDTRWYDISKKIQEVMEREVGHKGIYPNVDFFSASLYYYLGIEVEMYTPIFAVSRVAGWTAHVVEQLKHNRIFRPRSVYLGPAHMDYVPLDQRTES